MIRKLRFKFILTAMITILFLLAAIITITNYVNYHAAISEADDILILIPRYSSISKNTGEELFLPYESRFFSVTLDGNGNISEGNINLPSSADISEEQAVQYARQAASLHKKRGVIDNYRYILYDEKDNTLVEFINIGQQLASVRYFFRISVLISTGCYLIFFFVLLFFSGRFIKPVAQSYEKQKQFITNAGHGLKTPLTIIDADVEVLRMDLDDNEWLDDIQKQTSQLTSLTNDLVFLSKLEESDNYLKMIEFPFSELLEETTDSFRLLAAASGKTFQTEIAPMLTFVGDEKSIRQLISILLDNALKYSSPGGWILLTARKSGKSIQLAVTNTTDIIITKEEASLIFDRFYRIDSTLNSEIKGHGIGLSVAKAIVESHGGHIQAIPGTSEDTESLTPENTSASADGRPTIKIQISLPV